MSALASLEKWFGEVEKTPNIPEIFQQTVQFECVEIIVDVLNLIRNKVQELTIYMITQALMAAWFYGK